MEEFRKVTAPYDGVITARHVDIGDLVSSGSSANTSSLYSIAQSNVIRVFVDVPQKAAADMTVDLPAHASSDQYPGRLFSGKIARSAMSIDPQTRTQRTEVDIPNPDLTLVPGMYVQVTFELNQRKLPQVPAAAILFRPTGLQVAVVNADSKVEFHPVTVARDNGDTVELATGANPGDRVALNLSSAIMPGEQVNAVEVKQ
jgi:RND family efflux transporter MFP subunit